MFRLTLTFSYLIVAASILFYSPKALRADEEFTIEQLEFFENRIRPLLAKHCLECHGPDKSENDLRLDSREAVLAGGSSGELSAVAGKPDESLIVKAVRHVGDFEMPPSKHLTGEEISELASWVKMGLPWPESNAPIAQFTMPELIQRHRQSHWSFQPITAPQVPTVEGSASTALDKFVLAKLNSNNLSFSPRADRRTLIRRASFDLLGLPPTYEEVQSFVKDDSPAAYSQLIDRLLDSPHYGERWARHWLDVARYADTSGYTLDGIDNSYPFAFTYRDYVIDAFNRDLPYDQFIREQLAADYLPVAADNQTLAALGFITVGRKYLGAPDTIDDQVDVVTRGLMGLTVSCARCHDHKYDAIPTEDYYSIYSVFANNYIPDELPLIGSPDSQAAFESYFSQLAKLKQEIESFRTTRHEEIKTHFQKHVADYLAHVIAPNQDALIEQQSFNQLKSVEIQARILENWRRFLAQQHNQPTLIQPALELIGLPEDGYEAAAAKLIGHWETHPNEAKINPLFLEKLVLQPPTQKLDLARILGELFGETIEQWKQQGSKQPAIGQFTGPRQEIAAIVLAKKSPANFKIEAVDGYLGIPGQKEIRKLREAVGKHHADAPEGLARAMVLRDKERLVDERVMIRGNIDRRGDVAPRRFVAILSNLESLSDPSLGDPSLGDPSLGDPSLGDPSPSNSSKTSTAHPAERVVFQHKSGRLELAEKIASRNNPLTARVLVNRVWMHHFSRPLVDTPSDFGVRCEEPLQRDLLDHLASEFMDNEWSIKKLHRAIMLSDTYCQTSNDRADCREVDPENRLLWKMNRRRLEFEPLRDSILAVTGQLDLTMHGKAIKLFESPHSKRRTVYGLIDRQDLPGLYRVFDLASPDQSASKRIRTSVPQQSLFMMNSVFMNDQARHWVDSIGDRPDSSLQERVVSFYHTVYQRDPSAAELEIATNFIQAAEPKSDENHLGPWQRYVQMLLCANEFEFID